MIFHGNLNTMNNSCFTYSTDTGKGYFISNDVKFKGNIHLYETFSDELFKLHEIRRSTLYLILAPWDKNNKELNFNKDDIINYLLECDVDEFRIFMIMFKDTFKYSYYPTYVKLAYEELIPIFKEKRLKDYKMTCFVEGEKL